MAVSEPQMGPCPVSPASPLERAELRPAAPLAYLGKRTGNPWPSGGLWPASLGRGLLRPLSCTYPRLCPPRPWLLSRPFRGPREAASAHLPGRLLFRLEVPGNSRLGPLPQPPAHPNHLPTGPKGRGVCWKMAKGGPKGLSGVSRGLWARRARVCLPAPGTHFAISTADRHPAGVRPQQGGRGRRVD